MKKLISFINGWTAFGWLAMLSYEMYKLFHIAPVSSSILVGTLALFVICAGLFFIGIYNFVSIDENIDADTFFS